MPLPQCVLDLLGQISPIIVDIPLPQDEELLPEIRQNDDRPTVVIEDGDVNFTMSCMVGGVEMPMRMMMLLLLNRCLGIQEHLGCYKMKLRDNKPTTARQ